MLDGSRRAKHPPAGNGSEAQGVEKEEEGRRGRPTCLDPLSPAKGKSFRTITSDQLLGQGKIWREPVSVGIRSGWSKKKKKNLAAMKKQSVPLVHTANFLIRGEEQ